MLGSRLLAGYPASEVGFCFFYCKNSTLGMMTNHFASLSNRAQWVFPIFSPRTLPSSCHRTSCAPISCAWGRSAASQVLWDNAPSVLRLACAWETCPGLRSKSRKVPCESHRTSVRCHFARRADGDPLGKTDSKQAVACWSVSVAAYRHCCRIFQTGWSRGKSAGLQDLG